MEALKLALYAQNAYSTNPQGIEEHSELQRALVHLYNLRTQVNKFNRELCEEIDSAIKELQLDSVNQEFLSELLNDPDLPMVKLSQDESWVQLQDQFIVKPFSDLGEKRSIEWKALGISWHAHTPNRHTLVSALETLVATAQIVITDLAKVGLALLPTAVEIELSLDDIDELEATEHDGNDVVSCTVVFPRQWVESGADSEKLYIGCLGIVSSLLAKCSTLPRNGLMKQFEELFDQGLTHKISVIQPYPVLFNEFFPQT